MATGKSLKRILVVSGTEKAYDYITELLPREEYYPILHTKSAGEAKRILITDTVDIVIINTPLPDEFGTELALGLTDKVNGILLLVKNDLFDQVCDKVEDEGILTVGKPAGKQSLYGAVKLLSAVTTRFEKLEKEKKALQNKMDDIRVVNRAKWLLIENLGLSENDAHYHIEKKAMDNRLSRREAAEYIIRTYDI